MSRRTATTSPNTRNHRPAKYLPVLGLLVGALVVGFGGPVHGRGDDEIDDRQPLPATEPKRVALLEKYRIPNKDAAIYQGHKNAKTGVIDGGVQDFKPVATEKENADEYQAWHAVVSHAKQFTGSELEENAGRDLTRDDLVTNARTLARYRLELLRFSGKVTKVRWAKATRSLADVGTDKVYEALMVPFDEPPNALISVVFTELPPELVELNQKPAEEWIDVNSEGVAAGYFFKVKQDAPGHDPIPLLIGRSLTLKKAALPGASATGTVPGTGATGAVENPIALDKSLRVFKFIKDDAFIAKVDANGENWEELSAWNRILLHSRRFTPDEFEKAATEVRFSELFEANRRDYKLDLVKFEGRLIDLRKSKPSDKLLAAGVEAVYEGWMVPKDEPRGNPICVVFTDPPEGVEATGRVNKWVVFAGYSFKLLRYKSGESDKDDPNRKVTKRAPLLLGRGLIDKLDPDAVNREGWSGFMNTVLALLGGTIVVGGGLAWWFRRGDSKIRQEIEAHRNKNPFGGEQPGPSM